MLEEQRICGFFDALGTREIMLGDDMRRRMALLDLVRKFSSFTSDYSSNPQNLGSAISFAPSAQVTSFSDNIAVSLPLTELKLPGHVGGQPYTHCFDAKHFLQHLLIQVVIVVWDALKLGILIRGGISVGRLVHDQRVIAGSALVKAADLEKSTCLPRIEVEPAILELRDGKGTKLISDDLKKDCLYEADGRWFVNAIGFHAGYWRDHNWYRSQQGLPAQSIPDALFEIRTTLRAELETVRTRGDDNVLKKWEWFMNDFDATFDNGYWPGVVGAKEAVIRAANG